MKTEWSEYFKYICSVHSEEIAELLRDMKCETEEEKTACYYEQAALVAVNHFIGLLRETGIY